MHYNFFNKSNEQVLNLNQSRYTSPLYQINLKRGHCNINIRVTQVVLQITRRTQHNRIETR